MFDHNATLPKCLTVATVGRRYRVVTNRVENGSIVDERPVDDRVFDSVYDARRHLKSLKAKGA